MTRAIAFAFSLLCAVLAHGIAWGQPSPPPAVRQSGTVSAGNCVKWVGTNLVQDNGSPCTGSSFTAGTGISIAGAVIGIDPAVTSRFTGTPVSGNCASWSASGILSDAGSACAGGGAGGVAAISLSATPLTTPGYSSNCYPATAQTLADMTVYSFRVNLQKGTGTDSGISLMLNSSNAITIIWQADTNIVLVKTVGGSSTAVFATGNVAPPVANGTYEATLTVSIDSTNGLTAIGNFYSVRDTSWRAVTGLTLTTGSWQWCVIAPTAFTQIRNSGSGLLFTKPY